MAATYQVPFESAPHPTIAQDMRVLPTPKREVEIKVSKRYEPSLDEEISEEQATRYKNQLNVFERILYESKIFRCLVSNHFHLVRNQMILQEEITSCQRSMDRIAQKTQKLQERYRQHCTIIQQIMTKLRQAKKEGNTISLQMHMMDLKHETEKVTLVQIEILRERDNMRRLAKLKGEITSLEHIQPDYLIRTNVTDTSMEGTIQKIINNNRVKFEKYDSHIQDRTEELADEVGNLLPGQNPYDEELRQTVEQDSMYEKLIAELNVEPLQNRFDAMLGKDNGGTGGGGGNLPGGGFDEASDHISSNKSI